MKRFRKRVTALILCAALCLALPAPLFAENEGGAKKQFSDTQGHWAQEAVERWVDYGLLAGYPDGTFRPNNNITRAEFAAVLNGLLGYSTLSNPNPLPQNGQSRFAYAVPQNAWYYAAAHNLISVHILMAPNGGVELATSYVTREEVVYALYETMCLVGGDKEIFFEDNESISLWAKKAVDTLCSADIINGYPNGNFGPKNNITRAEFITILDNIIEMFISEPGDYTYTGTGRGMVYVDSNDVHLLIDPDWGGQESVPIQVFYSFNVKEPTGVTIKVNKPNKIIIFQNGQCDITYEEGTVSERISIRKLFGLVGDFFARWQHPDVESILIGLGGMLNFINGPTEIAVNRLHTDLLERSSIGSSASAANILRNGWGVTDKESLIETVNWLLYEGGHNSVFFDEAAYVAEMSASEKAQFSNSYLLDQIEMWSKKWGDTGIVAWDLCRASNVLQWGYTAGYITRKEVSELGKDAAIVAAKTFSTWEELYDNYLDGYAWWSRSDISEGRPREDIWEALNGFYPDIFRDKLLTDYKDKIDL